EGAAHVRLVWQDGKTRYALRLPYDNGQPELVASDSRGPAGLAARDEAAVALDHSQRKARLAAGKAERRLPRSPQLDVVGLGMTRAKVQAVVPRGQMVRPVPLADGVRLMFFTPNNPNATHAAREMFLRFGADGTVAEIRVRYQIGPRPADKDH